jgi:Lar family restriction alleviation protein
MSELKPCPFCGGKVEVLQYDGYIAVFCKNCNAQIFNDEFDDEKVINSWNTRAPILHWRSAAEKPEENKEVMIDIGYNCIEIIIYWEENIEYWKQVERWLPLSEVLEVIK